MKHIVLILALLAGCGTAPPPATQIVEVPVYRPFVKNVPPAPVYEFDKLPLDAPADVKVLALARDQPTGRTYEEKARGGAGRLPVVPLTVPACTRRRPWSRCRWRLWFWLRCIPTLLPAKAGKSTLQTLRRTRIEAIFPFQAQAKTPTLPHRGVCLRCALSGWHTCNSREVRIAFRPWSPPVMNGCKVSIRPACR